MSRLDHRARKASLSAAALMVLPVALAFPAIAGDWPWNDASLPAAQRAQMALEQMTEQEKLSLLHGVIAAPWGGKPKPAGSIGSAGYVPGIPRLGIPALQETDAELGVANPGDVRPGDTATAMPSDLALASTWDVGPRATSRPGSRRRSARERFQCPSWRHGKSHSRPARRPQFRIFLRGPSAHRRHGGRHDRRRAKPPHHLDDQALRPQRAGNRPGRPRRANRPGRDARIGPARLRDRHRARPPGRCDVRLQPGERTLLRAKTTGSSIKC